MNFAETTLEDNEKKCIQYPVTFGEACDEGFRNLSVFFIFLGFEQLFPFLDSEDPDIMAFK
jgi:hypothetical protein